jgi:hypothetical protein
MPLNRSAGRNVHIYDANDPTTVLGGLKLNNGVTNVSFYSMVEILFVFECTFILQDENGITVQRDNHPLHPGNYYILGTSGTGSFSVNNEPWLVRTLSISTGTCVEAFCNAVRARDGRCVISGEVAVEAEFDNWTGFEAAHVFPLAYKGHWVEHNYGRWISIQPATGGSINSVQNGLLLESGIHALFDNYLVSINPDV